MCVLQKKQSVFLDVFVITYSIVINISVLDFVAKCFYNCNFTTQKSQRLFDFQNLSAVCMPHLFGLRPQLARSFYYFTLMSSANRWRCFGRRNNTFTMNFPDHTLLYRMIFRGWHMPCGGPRHFPERVKVRERFAQDATAVVAGVGGVTIPAQDPSARPSSSLPPPPPSPSVIVAPPPLPCRLGRRRRCRRLRAFIARARPDWLAGWNRGRGLVDVIDFFFALYINFFFARP